jgi:hypothetical protein
MKNTCLILTFAFFILFLLPHGSATAGARGLRVVIIEIKTDEFLKSEAYQLSIDGGQPLSQDTTECWRTRATGGFGVIHFTRFKTPQGLDKNLAQSILNGDQQAMKTAQKVLRTPHDAMQNKSYDGMYIVQVTDKNVLLMGLGTKAPPNTQIPTKKVIFQWNRENSPETTANFELALCKAAKPMDYGFSP